jgi:ABC-type phosphate transport system permease subunit
MNFRLRDADRTLKLFLTAFLIVLTIGYAIGLLFVEHQTSITSTGVQEQFLGNENSPNAEEIKYAKSANAMFTFMHTHILSLSLVFFAVGAVFYFTSAPPLLKRFLILEPFAAILTTFGGIALVRYVSDAWSWLVILSGVSLFVSYVSILGLILYEMWFQRHGAKK